MKTKHEEKLAEEQEQIKAEELAQEETQTEKTEEKAETSDNSADKEEEKQEETLETKYERLNDTHLRLMAEYDNYRKRTLKEKSELIRNGGEKTLKDLLPVIDDLDIALANIEKAEDLASVVEGVKLIHAKFLDFLKRQGVQAIETEGQNFDDELHEAIATFPAQEEEQKGKIIDCVKKGYTLNEKVMRHASVVVGQ